VPQRPSNDVCPAGPDLYDDAPSPGQLNGASRTVPNETSQQLRVQLASAQDTCDDGRPAIQLDHRVGGQPLTEVGDSTHPHTCSQYAGPGRPRHLENSRVAAYVEQPSGRVEPPLRFGA
jgi:hypothetical protein